MRRKYFGLAIAAIATLGPMQAFGGDREIAEQIIQRLKQNRDSGALEDFTLDLKVDKGVVLFRGNVSEQAQKDLVLQAAGQIDGITNIVDEVSVTADKQPTVSFVKPKAMVAMVTEEVKELLPVPKTSDDEFSMRSALAQEATVRKSPQEVVPGEVRMTSAVEFATPPAQVTNSAPPMPVVVSTPVTVNSDKQLVTNVVAALGRAKEAGQLKGFGVDVQSRQGVVQLQGRANSVSQRDRIVDITRQIPGVVEIREAIAIPSESPSLPELPSPPALAQAQTQAVPVSNRIAAPAQAASAQIATYRSQPSGVPAQTVQYGGAVAGAPVMGQPVPMAPYSGVAGAPRYDSPQLPNYAWPGYASHPNYAALTYPQQYSPSAWPYIGPFYPYPQVPLGWRKISLEWDDGWWFLDFTDK
jgi:osmotically-inducible protein OsmY